MESKILKVKEKKIEKMVEYYNAFGWNQVGEPERVKENSDVFILKFERDDKALGSSYSIIIKAEKVYRKIARPYPLGFLISFVIGAVLLALYFTLQKTFAFYIIFLYLGLMFLAISVYLLVVFLLIFIKRRGLLKKVVRNVSIDAGTNKEYPLRNNIKPETDQTWLISENL